MIDSISQHLAAQQSFKLQQLEQSKLKSVEFPGGVEGTPEVRETKAFDGVLGKLVKEVDSKSKAAIAETNKMLLGETDNIHSSMIAMQESGVAFSMMVEVRNKLMSAYQELIKMPV